MKNLILILTAVLFNPVEIKACDCPFKKLDELQKQETEFSECIFVGKITQVNSDSTYEVMVVESLDGGDLQGNIYIGQNLEHCYPFVEEEGMWLIYAGMENGLLKMNICGLSRPFDYPFAPLSKSQELDEYSKKIGVAKMSENEFYTGISNLHRIDLANEINALRKRRGYMIKSGR